MNSDDGWEEGRTRRYLGVGLVDDNWYAKTKTTRNAETESHEIIEKEDEVWQRKAETGRNGTIASIDEFLPAELWILRVLSRLIFCFHQ